MLGRGRTLGSGTAGQLPGTTTNDNAAAGNVGEFVTGAASSVSLTTATATNIITISLTAGDWDVSGTVDFASAATTNVRTLIAGISTTSATFGAYQTNYQMNLGDAGVASASMQDRIVSTPIVRMSIAATTTIYLVALGGFSVSTMTANGTLRARRVR